MEEANKRCETIKTIYERCYRKWYREEFMQGKFEPACQDEFEEYKDCVRIAMRNKKNLQEHKDLNVP